MAHIVLHWQRIIYKDDWAHLCDCTVLMYISEKMSSVLVRTGDSKRYDAAHPLTPDRIAFCIHSFVTHCHIYSVRRNNLSGHCSS